MLMVVIFALESVILDKCDSYWQDNQGVKACEIR